MNSDTRPISFSCTTLLKSVWLHHFLFLLIVAFPPKIHHSQWTTSVYPYPLHPLLLDQLCWRPLAQCPKSPLFFVLHLFKFTLNLVLAKSTVCGCPAPVLHPFGYPLWTPPSASPDDTNIVRESTEIVDVSPSITTNVIGQKTDEVGPDMCEHSCEELSAMFQELNGLRVVVSNLIDGLQKVVSLKCCFSVPCLFLLRMERLLLLLPKENQHFRENWHFKKIKHAILSTVARGQEVGIRLLGNLHCFKKQTAFRRRTVYRMSRDDWTCLTPAIPGSMSQTDFMTCYMWI